MPKIKDKELLDALLGEMGLELNDVFSMSLDGELQVKLPEKEETSEEPENTEDESKEEESEETEVPEEEEKDEETEVQEAPKPKSKAKVNTRESATDTKLTNKAINDLSHQDFWAQEEELDKAYIEGRID